MEPALLARELRRIATAINNSEMPSRKLVYQDIKRLIHNIATDGESQSVAAGAKGIKMVHVENPSARKPIETVLNYLAEQDGPDCHRTVMKALNLIGSDVKVDEEGDYR